VGKYFNKEQKLKYAEKHWKMGPADSYLLTSADYCLLFPSY
jgi:hypothetical protein